MNRDSVSWQGAMPAVITPFDASGAIDAALFTSNIERLMNQGATGIVVCGCTGEFWSMTAEERAALFGLAVRTVADVGGGTVLAGAGCITAGDTVALTRLAQDAGCDGALILPPYFVKLTDDEIFGHYETIVKAISLPICLYNIPGNAVNALTPALVRRLAELDTVVAVKESSGDWNNYYATALAAQDRLRVFCGPSSVFGVAATMLGADGLIDCFPNVWAGCLDMFRAARDGRVEEARRLQELGWALTALFTSGGRTLYPSTKAAMQMLGLPGGMPRPPLRALAHAQAEGLRQGLRGLGLLDRQAAAA